MGISDLRIFERLLWAWTEFARRRARVVLTVFVAAAVAATAYAATHLSVNTDTREMINSELPFRQAELSFQEAFPQLKNAVVIVVRADTFDEADYYSKMLAERLRGDAAIQDVFAPAVDPFFVRNGLLYLDVGELETLLSRLTKAAPLLTEIRNDPTLNTLFAALAANVTLAREADIDDDMLDRVYVHFAEVVEARLAGAPETFSWQALLSDELEDGAVHQRLITVTPILDFTALQPAKAALAAIRAQIEALDQEADFNVDVGVTGDPALRTEELRSVSEGIGLSLAVSLIAVAFLLLLALGSVRLAAVSLGVLLITLALTLGFASFAVGALNLVSVAFVVLLVGLGIDFVIHYALHIRDSIGWGLNLRKALTRGAREVGGPLALAAFTTTIAFFAFIPTDFVGMAQLGIISGVGVIIAFVTTLTVLPAAFALMKPSVLKRKPIVAKGNGEALRTLRWVLAGVLLLVGLAAIPLLPQARFDADPMALRDPNSPSVVAFSKLFDDRDTAPYRLSAVVEDLDAATQLSARLDALAEVDRAVTFADFVPARQDEKLELIDFTGSSLLFDLQRSAPPAAPAYGEIDGAVELRARVSGEPDGAPGARLRDALDAFIAARAEDSDLAPALERDFFRFWDYQYNRLISQLQPDYVTLDMTPREIEQRFIAADGRARVEITPVADLQDTAARRAFVAAVEGVYEQPAGSARAVLKAGEAVSGAMLQASIGAIVAVALLLLLILRRLSLVAIVLFPLVLAGVLTAASSVLLGMPFNYANVIVLPLLIGLGVDSGIHLALRRPPAHEKARSVFDTTTPRAVMFSAATTIASFGSLALSSHRGTASMGMLLTVAVAFTLLCTMILVPSFVDLLNGAGARANARNRDMSARRGD